MKHQRAFTLIEILIVVVILGILAAVIVPQFTNASKDAISNSMAVNAKLIRTQIQIHAAKGDVELTDDGFPVNLDGAWFAGGGLPRHGYSNKRIQVILAPSFLSDRIYPLFKTYNVSLSNPNTAGTTRQTVRSRCGFPTIWATMRPRWRHSIRPTAFPLRI